ncbi:hypothetical protein [Tychonema sp. BBK16]|uniref:hypothetical protein n=1 Tax=Tychonema sp. BBK16 TaxID=2699888 RepID=UPI001F439E15|nr:hypothetical protein [Tychonema sp. BBK16]MCF6372765.1 hypothetical protein [Tychonema sp. BBK16]
MSHIYKQFGYLAIALTAIGLFSCSSSDGATSAENQDQASTKVSQFAQLQKTRHQIEAVSSQLVQPFNPVPPALASVAASENTVTVTMYKVDNNCQSLNPETVTGLDNQLMSSAVNEVLKQQVFSSLGLVGYRLRIDRNLGVATVDLRTSGNDRQKLQNLSSCQMLGLFGGLRQTLTSYAPWQIKTVRFTELGEDILNTVRE